MHSKHKPILYNKSDMNTKIDIASAATEWLSHAMDEWFLLLVVPEGRRLVVVPSFCCVLLPDGTNTKEGPVRVPDPTIMSWPLTDSLHVSCTVAIQGPLLELVYRIDVRLRKDSGIE
jgi:hypothetical protein